VSKTLDGMITSWNSASERMFGYTAQEAIGQHISLIIPPELRQEEEKIIRKLRQGIRTQHYETVRRRKDGTNVDVSLSISPIKDGAGNITGAAKIARDITERLEIERRKDEFISMASHELKTPVTSIKGFTQLLRRRFQKRDDQESIHFLARMDVQLIKLTQLIHDLLDISKMQTGQLVYREEPFELDVLVQEIIENMQGTTQTHLLILEKAERVRVFGDRDRLGQVLMNLLTNAIKYSSRADKVLVQVVAEGTQAVVRVQDFGVGIAKAYQEKIFERFYQVSEPEMKTYPGLGIGLYIASEIIKRHQGCIWVESRKGAGSTFSFRLPLRYVAYNIQCS
jgi:PAS domain S-box-containing protein